MKIKGLKTFTFCSLLLITYPNDNLHSDEVTAGIILGKLANVLTDTTADAIINTKTWDPIIKSIQSGSINGVINSVGGFLIWNLIYQCAISAGVIKDTKAQEMFLDSLRVFVSLSMPDNQKNLLQINTSYNKNFNNIKDTLFSIKLPKNKLYKIDKNQLTEINLHDILSLIAGIVDYVTKNHPYEKSTEELLNLYYKCIESIEDKNFSTGKKTYPKNLITKIKISLKEIFKLITLHNLSTKAKELNSQLKVEDVNKILTFSKPTQNINIAPGVLNTILENTKEKITSIFTVIKDTFVKGAFNLYISNFIKIINIIKNTGKKQTEHSLKNIKDQYGGLAGQSIATPVISFIAGSKIPEVSTLLSNATWVGTLLSTATWIADHYVGKYLQKTDATKKMSVLFENLDVSIKETVKYLFDGLFFELDKLNSIKMRSIGKIKSINNENLLKCFLSELETIFQYIYKTESLKNLSPTEIANFITTTVLSTTDKKTILEQILSKHLGDSQNKKMPQIIEYYTKFITIYCQFIQLFENLKHINDFYNFCIANKSTVEELTQKDSPYNKILKKTLLYFDDLNGKKIFANKITKDSTIGEYTNIFNSFTSKDQNREIAHQAQELMDTLSYCIVLHERNNGMLVGLGRTLHIDKEKQSTNGNKVLAGKVGSVINWGTKKLTNSKFKIFTNEELKAILENKGIHFYNQNATKGINNEQLELLKKFILIKDVLHMTNEKPRNIHNVETSN